MFDDVNKLALVKELKDVGFPLKPATMGSDAARIKSFGYEGIWLFPTLEELIEACGERFGGLSKKNGAFRAYTPFFVSNDVANEVEWYGPTPTEAVANLWLALNKK